MIESLKIKNFRGISSSTVDHLAQTNIFIGKNNSGKSSILESLYFARAPFSPVNQLNEPVLQHLLQRRITRPLLDVREFFREYGKYGDIEIGTQLGDRVIPLRVHLSQNGRVLTYVLGVGPQNEPATIALSPQSESGVIQFPRLGNLAIPQGFEQLSQLGPEPQKVKAAYDFLSSITLIDAEFVRKIQTIETRFWGKIFEDRADRTLREVLNTIYGAKVEQFSFAPYEDQFKLLTALSKHSVYIDDYGDGFRYAFAILSLASQLNDTALLLEEPEVHQHTGALRLLFEALTSLADRNHIQLFISTHSLDLVNILLQSENTKLFHCDVVESGEFIARPLLTPDVRLLTDLGVDVVTFIEAKRFLCLEGHNDRLFVETIAKKLGKFGTSSLGYDIIEASKPEQKTVVSALATTGKPIIVLADLDKNNKESIFQSFADTITKKFPKSERSIPSVRIPETGSVVDIFFVGLPSDPHLTAIGIDSHAMEDYLLKMIETDDAVKAWAGVALLDLRKRAESFKSETNLKISKTILSTLGVMKNGLYLEDLIKTIIQTADEKSVRSIIGPLSELFV